MDGFDFNIEYKEGKDNCVADLLTKEEKYYGHHSPKIKIFSCITFDESSSFVSSFRNPPLAPPEYRWVHVCNKYFHVEFLQECVARFDL